MYVLLFFSVIALFLTYLSSRGAKIDGLKVGLFLMTMLAAIHYNFGSDYPVYLDNFKEFISSRYSFKDVITGEVVLGDFGGRTVEIGWLLLMYFVKPFGIEGFYVLVALISCFEGAVIFQLIKKYVPEKWHVFSLFIYLFTTALYVGSMSGLRQGTAIAIIGCALPLILNKKWLYSILVIVIAFFFHKSAIVFAPFAFWGVISQRRKKLLALLYLSVVIFLYIFKDNIKVILDFFFAYENFEAYQHYAEREIDATYGIGFLLGLIPAFLSLSVIWKGTTSDTSFRIISLAAVSYVLLPIANNVALAERIAYYFQYISILALPYCYASVKDKAVRIVLLALYILLSLYSYNNYFHLPERYESTFIYHSLFDLL